MAGRRPIDVLLDRVEWKCVVCDEPRAKGCDCFITLACPSCGKTKMTRRIDDDPPGPVLTMQCPDCYGPDALSEEHSR